MPGKSFSNTVVRLTARALSKIYSSRVSASQMQPAVTVADDYPLTSQIIYTKHKTPQDIRDELKRKFTG